MLQLDHLTLTKDGVAWLQEISLQIPKGGMTTILGRTGASKTSLLRAIAGLEHPQARGLSFDGQDLLIRPPWQRPVAMVTQQFINYPHLNVLENVAFPLRRQGLARAEAHARAAQILGKVGLNGFADRPIAALSGGQQQRVAIARALVRQAPLLLLDEPFVNLDYKLREGLREELAELLRDSPETTVLYATTDPREALQMGDRVVVMADGQILQIGAPRQVYEAPASLRAAQVITDPPLNILPIDQQSGQLLGLKSGDSPTLPSNLPSQTACLGLRANALHPDGPLRAKVMLSEMSGSETVTHLQLDQLSLVMWERAVVNRAPQSRIDLRLDLSQALAFDGAGKLLNPQEAPHG